MAIEVVAILSPAPGKSDRAIELLTAHAQYVKDNEPNTTKYQLHKQINSNDLVMIETYVQLSPIPSLPSLPNFRIL